MLSSDWLRLSHELRTPLNAILGGLELLLDGSAGPLSGEARACLNDVRSAARRLMGRVHLLLLLSQIQEVRSPDATAPVDLIDRLKRALAAASGTDAKTLHLEPADARLVVRGDPVWLEPLAAAIVDAASEARPDAAALAVSVLHAASGSGVATLRVWWQGFDPNGVPPMQCALIDAIVGLHGGATALLADGMSLLWPALRVVEEHDGGGVHEVASRG
ncbi:MAG: sensor histidine kinase [Geminicoccales bacterium]